VIQQQKDLFTTSETNVTQDQERVGFGERTVNKFIELVLSRLVDAERLQARIKTSFKKLSQGELESLAIAMAGFRLRPEFRLAEFNFDIGPSAVNLQSVKKRKIELLHPCEGTIRFVVNQAQLSGSLQAELLAQVPEVEGSVLESVQCELRTEGAIAFVFHWLEDKQPQSGTYLVAPGIASDRQDVILEWQGVEGIEPPATWIQAALTHTKAILNLEDIANQGTTFEIQNLGIEGDRILVEMAAHIAHFPTR
jgi:hypothetical protein